MSQAYVNAILPISTVDGPGARSTIFLQGCNVACAYCHNPETQQLCCHCGDCVATCPSGALSVVANKVIFERSKCCDCDACIKTCKHRSTPKARWMSAQDVFAEVARNRTFLRGITVSGGECMLKPDFLTELFGLVKSIGLTTLIDSNGTIDFALYPNLLEVTDGVMLDIKAWQLPVWSNLLSHAANASASEAIRKKSNGLHQIMLRNITTLLKSNKLAEIRIVVMRDHVDSETIIDQLATNFGNSIYDIPLKLIGFRTHNAPFPASEMMATPRQDLDVLCNYAKNLGFRYVCVR